MQMIENTKKSKINKFIIVVNNNHDNNDVANHLGFKGQENIRVNIFVIYWKWSRSQ